MVAIAQLAEHRIVAPKVTGSSPVSHPTTSSTNGPISACRLASTEPEHLVHPVGRMPLQ